MPFLTKSFSFIVCLVVSIGIATPANGAPAACKTFSTGRTTCSYSSGGSTYYNSYNPYSGYSSYGSRTQNGSSSYGYNSYSTPKSYGYNSYNSYGLGSGSSSTNSYGWNSKSGSYSNSYGGSSGTCYIFCP